MIENGTTNQTIYLDEDGDEYFPCRCGKEHRGDAIYDYGHHQCFHEVTLFKIAKNYVICPDCGKTWHIED